MADAWRAGFSLYGLGAVVLLSLGACGKTSRSSEHGASGGSGVNAAGEGAGATATSGRGGAGPSAGQGAGGGAGTSRSGGSGPEATGGAGGATGGGGRPPAGGATSQGGASGDAGGAGEAGASAAGGTGGCAAGCDDGDACTLDALADDCTCRHEPAPDGTPCDDGDACTDSDRCEAGSCQGTPRTSAATVLGEVEAYGGEPGLRTIMAFPSADRAVFARSRRLSLVGLDGDRATLLDDVAMGPDVRSDSIGSMFWASRPHTFLIPVLEHHLAVVSEGRGIDLFDMTGDALAPSERYGDPGSTLDAAAGSGSHLYTCSGYAIQAWSISDTDFLISKGNSLALAAGHRCEDLALAPDGSTLYVGTQSSLDRVLIAADGTLTLGTGGRAGQLVADVQALGSYVAVFEAREMTSGNGDVTVLDADTLAEVQKFPADLSPGGIVPVGFALLDGGRVLIQSERWDDAGCATAEAAVWALDGTPSELDHVPLLAACTSPFGQSSFNTAAGGDYAVLEPMHQLVRVDPDSGKLALVSSPSQGSPQAVLASGPDAVLGFGPGSVQRFDVSNPSAPRALDGGLVSPLELEWLRLDVSNRNGARFVTVEDPAYGGGLSGARTTLLAADASGLPRVVGSVVNDDDASVWIAGGSDVYEVAPVGAADFDVQRYAVAALAPAMGQTLSPASTQTLATEPAAGLDERGAPLLGLAPSGDRLVVLEPRSNPSVSSSDAGVLTVFDRNGDAFERRFSRTLDGRVGSLAVGSDRVAVVLDGTLNVVDFDGNQTSSDLAGALGVALESVLAFEQDRIVLAASWSSPSATEGVVVVDAADFTEVARYPTTQAVTSFATAGDNYVFGARSSITLAAPACVP